MAAGNVNPASLTVDEAAALLRVEAATVRGHVAAGLPTDERGRIHLVEYVAWMILELSQVPGGAAGGEK
jgi:hypothetical protein